jgi:hypothetical protein
MSRRLRQIAEAFVVAPPAGTRVRTRLRVSDADAMVLAKVGAHLGSLAGADLARRCAERRLDADGRKVSRQARKRALTAGSSSRWAGAITRTTNDAWALAERNLIAERASLRARVKTIRRRLAAPVAGRDGRTRGYAARIERWEKQQRLQCLEARLAVAGARLAEGRLSIVRGGRRLARSRHNLDAAGLDQTAWRQCWQAQRWFICADGEADKRWGNETIRWHPDEGWVEIKLPAPLASLANRPHGRYRLSCPVMFPHRGGEVAAQASSGTVRYDITYDPGRGRWYLDASWKTGSGSTLSLPVLRCHPVLAVDLNAGHLACWVINPDGNPVGRPITVSLDLSGLPASTRDGRLRAAISQLLGIATGHGCQAIIIENLEFGQARAEGRERAERRPSRGQRGRAFRRLIAGIPTRRFRDRLTQMASNRGVAVVAVDPAYTSTWAAQHWLAPLNHHFSPTAISGHHAAAVVIGRRGLGQRARRTARRDRTRPEDRERRAASPATVRPAPSAPAGGLSGQRTRKPGDRKARGQPPARRCNTRRAEPANPRRLGQRRPFAPPGSHHQPTLIDADE